MHKKYLLTTLELARLGQGRCAPNPCVGAIAVQHGIIIAQAYHQGAGTPHAEQLLLTQFPPKTPGVCVYISLEPCNHWGRTPPCVKALIEHGGIERVVFAYHDPNPIVANNKSSEKLRAHGIEVLYYPITEINNFYQSYTHWTLTKTPWVTVKIAQTLNGKIGHIHSERVVLSNNLCSEFTHRQRAATDVILSSSQTIKMDNPQLNCRVQSHVIPKPLALIDKNLSINPDAKIFKTAQHCFVYYHCDKKVTFERSTLHHVPLDGAGLDLRAVFEHLGQQGYHDVWVEAGAGLFNYLHSQRLVHRTYLYLVPHILEEQALSLYSECNFFQLPHSIAWLPMDDNMIACIDWHNP